VLDKTTKFTSLCLGDCIDNDATVTPRLSRDVGGNTVTVMARLTKKGQMGNVAQMETAFFHLDADYHTYGFTGDTKCLCTLGGLYRATVGYDFDDNDPVCTLVVLLYVR